MHFCTYISTLLLFSSINVRQILAGAVAEPQDVLFLIDGSGSVKPRNFDKLRVHLKNIIRKMNVNYNNGNRISVLQFSSKEKTKVEFNLDTYKDDVQAMEDAIDDMVYQKKWTYTGYAMEMANKEVFNGRGGDRPDVKNAIILFTDGHSADPHVADAASKTMKARGDHVMTVGFGSKRSIKRFKHELKAISTDEDKDVFEGLDNADEIVARLAEAVFESQSGPVAKVDCNSNPCRNGATCVVPEEGGFLCRCSPDWKGLLCDKRKGPCDYKPCLNDGVCEENGDVFKCTCGENFQGVTCETRRVVCTTKSADILFIMDDSRSIKNADFTKMKNFVVELVKRFNISKDQSHVALLQFSDKDNTVVKFHLNADYRKASLVRRIQNTIQSDGGATDTDRALKMAREQIFNGKKGDRSNVRDVIILLTDGASHNEQAAIQEAGLLRDADVSIISIGVGKGESEITFVKFLEDISFGADFVFKVSYTLLDTILDGVTRAACENLQETDT